MIAKILLFLFLSAATVLAQAVPVNSFTDANGNTLRLSSPFDDIPNDGFYPLIVEMTSRSRDARWSVNQNTNGYGEFRRNMIFECPAGESRTTTVLMASGSERGGYSYGINLEIFASGVSDSVRFSEQNQSGTFEGVLKGATSTMGRGNMFSGTGMTDFNTGIAPTDWRAYVGYRGIVVADSEWRAMEPGARVAISHYVKSGGALVVIVPDETSASTLPGFPKPEDPNRPGHVGLGKAMTVVNEKLDPEFINKAVATKASYSDSLAEWKRNAPEFFPKRSSTLTSLLMLVVLVGFAVLIGPVNLFLLAPAKRRHRLFFSVPVIALSTSALLLVFVLLGDGLGGKGHRFLLIENRPGEGEAVNHVIQYQTSRCGVLFSTDFASGVSATIQNLTDGSSDYRYSGSGAAKELIADPDNLEGNGAWFVSRTSQNYRVTATVPGRGRIEIRGSGASAKLTSTFAFPLDALWFRDTEGNWWKTGPMKMGEPVGVQPVNATEPRTEWSTLLDKAPDEIASRANEAAQRRGSFIAFTSAPEGVKTHASIRWTDQAVITGPLFQP